MTSVPIENSLMETRFRVLFAVTIIFVFPPRNAHPQPTSLTDSLTAAFHREWNENDLDGMLSLLQPDAFFKSPHQMRYGRDTMAATVLKRNPPIIRDCRSEESYSRVEGALAWSIGKLYCNIYYRESGRIKRERFTDADGALKRRTFDEGGNVVGVTDYAGVEYLYVFSLDEEGVWKVQMLVYHE